MGEACDAPAKGGTLLAFDEAVARALLLARPVHGTETLALGDAVGRVLAGPVFTPVPLPPFDNSAMDGYAVRRADLIGEGPWRLSLAQRIAAGDASGGALPQGSAARILTGAPVPDGADAVVMQEETAAEGACVVIRRRPRPGENIRRAGEDLAQGSAILDGGVTIGAREAGALAAVGAASVAVRRRLRIAFFSTGSELRQPGEALGPGQIWNSNRFQLGAALALPWIEPIDLGAVPDEPEALRAALERAAAIADLVVTTGGVSVGEEDHMPRLLAEAGGEAHVMKVAMKPGKPLTVGRLGGAVYFGLPGNPVSAFVTWRLIGARVAAACGGIARHEPLVTMARAAAGEARRPGRIEFRPARLAGGVSLTAPAGEEPRIDLLKPSFSGRVALLCAADGLAVIPAEAGYIAEGDLLRFLPF
ncbi:MAG: molybdopterin molybdotransferase MoeA [Aquamicrobium sp.]|uniref:molybdopterin molybdotransferase MoeA n=1 Tax=Aquamicrobium sp. TaxID=1872579 RepID=UPI00349E60BD|nr:molybdopterin molybdotransferase MoeA [Aquamicrobium sp.]